jgi:nucleotide-binding universal stress UspA family protein
VLAVDRALQGLLKTFDGSPVAIHDSTIHQEQFTIMYTILVPTDFSPTARNAAMYAANFAKQMKGNRIILYNAYQAPVITDANMTMVETVDIHELEMSSKENLEQFKTSLRPYFDNEVTIDTLSEYGMITADINDICTSNNVDFIVMGVTGGGKLEETLIGSFAIDIARHAEVPVIIVPPNAVFSEINEVMLACDFSKVAETTPVAPIKKILDATGAKLIVVNIDHKHKHFSTDTPFQSLMLDTLLQGYNPEYKFIDDVDFVEGINKVALETKTDLIITIPKKMGWFDSLFKKSHTKMLAFHSHVPLMVIH